MEEKQLTIQQAHKYFGVELNRLTWSLLEKENRTRDEDEQMLHAVHASHFHWLSHGTNVNKQRGEWLIARVYSTLNVPERALYHALRCKEITDKHTNEMSDFDIAYADEGLARAYACGGNKEESMKYYKSATEKGSNIADKEDREIFNGDFEAGPWFGMISK